MTPYLNLLYNDAFGNYRDILYNVTLKPGDGSLPQHEHEHARPTRTRTTRARSCSCSRSGRTCSTWTARRRTTAWGERLPTYDQSVIDNLKLVLTGWKIQNNVTCDPASQQGSNCSDYLNPMIVRHEQAQRHRQGAVPGLPPQPGRRRLPDQHHGGSAGRLRAQRRDRRAVQPPNVGPYVARELIHSLVTSNPSPAYVERVAWAFNDDGSGVRGSLWAVVKAILLDPEARSFPRGPQLRQAQGAGALRAERAQGVQPPVHEPAPPERRQHQRPAARHGPGHLQAPTVFSYFPQDYFAPPASAEIVRPRVRHHGRFDLAQARQLRQHDDVRRRNPAQRHRHAQRNLDRFRPSSSSWRPTRATWWIGSTACSCTARCPTTCGTPSSPPSMRSLRRRTR